MKIKDDFLKTVLKIALPVSLQMILQNSVLSFADQIMIGQLGSTSVAAIGLVAKFNNILMIVFSAISTVAAIIIAQNLGQKDDEDVYEGFWTSLIIMLGLAGIFSAATFVFAENIIGIYSNDPETIKFSVEYLRIVLFSYIPMALVSILSVMLRCLENTRSIMVAGLSGTALNIALNYILIFGKLGIEPLGIKGAAIASVSGYILNTSVLLISLVCVLRKIKMKIPFGIMKKRSDWEPFIKMFWPVLLGSIIWSFGDNAYVAVFGNMGTESVAAFTLTQPIQGAVTGLLTGITTAASVLVSKMLGEKEFEKAYESSMKLIKYGVIGTLSCSVIIVLISGIYPLMFNVEESVMKTTSALLVIFAFYAPVKMTNMIISNGIIKNGGKTIFSMVCDFIGTWLVGIPLAFITAFVLKLPIIAVYAIFSIEECLRCFAMYKEVKRKKWMQVLPDEN